MLAVGLAGLMDPLRIDRPRNYARQAQFVINVMISWGIYVCVHHTFLARNVCFYKRQA